MILLFLFNLTGVIGPSWGYYSPSLDSLNSWLYIHDMRKMRTASMTIGVDARLHLLRHLSVEAGVNYHKAHSKDRMRSLSLIPVDVYLTYKHTLFPIFLHAYVGAGLGICLTEYKDEEYKDEELAFEGRGGASGPLMKGGLEFIPTPRFAAQFSVGYRFEKALDIGLNDPETKNNIPLNLWGGYIKLTLERLLK